MIKLWMGLGLLLVGCGGSSPEPAEPSPEPPPAEPATDGAFEAEPAVAAEAPVGSAADPEPAVGSEEEEQPLGATVEETRTTEVIRDVVNQNRDSVRRCYDNLPQEEKGTGGMLTISFKLGPKGDVQSATLNEERSTLEVPKLVSCAIAAIQAMKFPPSSRGFESSINYPFNFKP